MSIWANDNISSFVLSNLNSLCIYALVKCITIGLDDGIFPFQYHAIT